jgi:cytochrome c oxidase subunit 4
MSASANPPDATAATRAAAATTQAGPHTQIQEAGHEVQHPSRLEYVRIAMILGVITAGEVVSWYARDTLGSFLFILMLFVFAITKFTLVVMWFMHLRFDSRTFSRFFVMGLAGAVTLYSVVLMSLRVFLK